VKKIALLGLVTLSLGLFLGLLPAGAIADDSQLLIDLDKKWGSAGVSGDDAAIAAILSDDLVAVTVDGVGDKASQLNQPAPADTKYEPTDFKVVFLDDTTAIMTHGTKGEDAHYSLHVWSKKSGKWQVVATSSTPATGD
jgi:hypothetical protein